jgi:Protein of unknown function (DUF2752)
LIETLKAWQPMHIRPLSNPWRNSRSQALLAGIAFWGALACLSGPSAEAGRKIWLPPCPLKMIADLPCPFCGLTTGSAWMIRGELVHAFQSNILAPALGIGLLIAAIYILCCRMVLGFALELSAAHRRALWLIAGLLVALSWAVNLYRTITL